MAETRDPAEAAGPAPPRTSLSDTDLGPPEGRSAGRHAETDSRTRRRRPEPEGLGGALRELVPLVLSALVLAILIKSFLIQAFFIPSASMEPTLEPGDRILVCRICKVFSDVTYGNVIVFSDPHPAPHEDRGIAGGFLHWLGEGIGVARPEDADFIKRVVAMEGDTWEMRRGVMFVNGIQVREPYLAAERDSRDFGPETVPDGMLFVLGDNRLHSGDSRFPPPGGLGYIPEEKVVGEAFVIAWPFGRIGGID
ncbi:MAG: signal peptidase I [Actinomycetota bacterium]|nr:signal peptidase I [Actinomycetota bacterium]